MLRKTNHRYLAGIVLGIFGCSNLVFADNQSSCDDGFVEIEFRGKGVTNAIADPYNAITPWDPKNRYAASLGTVKLKSKRPYRIRLNCGVRGVVTSPAMPDLSPPYTTELTTTFTSYIACNDDAHTEAVVYSDAFFQPSEIFLGKPCGFYDTDEYNPDDIYDPSSAVNGPFEEPGVGFEGRWGLLKGATGTFDISGISSCGLQEWKVKATVCVNRDILEEYLDDDEDED